MEIIRVLADPGQPIFLAEEDGPVCSSPRKLLGRPNSQFPISHDRRSGKTATKATARDGR